jgi:hypothetical protein
MANVRGILVKVKGDGGAFASAAAKSFGAGGLEIEPILHIPAKANGRKGFAADGGRTWLRVQQRGGTGTAWDLAHELLAPNQPFAAAAQSGIEAIEPDFEQEWPFREKPEPGKGFAASSMAELCAFDPQSAGGGKAVGPDIAWNLNPSFSELANARARVGAKLEKVVIAHLDTGYDPTHITLPKNLRRDLQRNFVADDNRPDDASDQTPQGMTFLQNRGHGTGTLSLLAGNKLDGTSPQWNGFTDFVGGAPLAQIIPVRIANWVVRFSTSTMVKGFDYAREKGAHVLSMSMGGLSSEALVDAINLAYDAGLVMVTAGGNNFADVLSAIVFPARYRRVLAACGVMADGRAYSGLKTGTMQGNYGPASKMDTAIGAYTPNVPWAQIDCGKIVDMDGAGTSAATPQVAAAVALWLAEYFDDVMNYPQPWMRVEAVRHALFKAAEKTTAKMNAAETREKIGQGVLKAHAALDVRPPAASTLTKLPPAEASWSWLDMLFGVNVSLAPGEKRSAQREAMLKLELTQLAARDEKVAEAIADPEAPRGKISDAARKRYLEAALDSGKTSAPLRQFLERKLRRRSAASTKPAREDRPFRKKVKTPPAGRRLRVYALDPSVAKNLASEAVNQTTLVVPWDDTPENPLRPGPVGEYLEVVDIDPASDRVYEPVDLSDKVLLAQDGWAPSEGNPQFHQQMVYAVGMTTIRHFEQALGRKALWAPHRIRGEDKPVEVPRLRIYPHALRTSNAYYSPEKKALLFGYFPAASSDADTTAPGSMVFSCLSTDIIAHEMSHALLDGLHRRFQEASNPDVPAFHEAFADIVALFQHFTVPELVHFEIARARGDLSAAGLLSGLARQFGEGSSRGGPLRNYGDKAMEMLRYLDTMESHDRGSILVFAVYNAFTNIVARRTEDLIRLATGGTGVLPDGALHPDLVNRLTQETCKTAKHVLHMCIRALDYCPAVDITFGEYLRALITADFDLVEDDSRYGYRVAFMEAFRKRGILPTDVRTISSESLRWNAPDDPTPEWLPQLIEAIEVHWNRNASRSTIFELNEKNRWAVWRALREIFATGKQEPPYRNFGLVPGLARYNADGTVLREVSRGDTTFEVFGVRPARRVGPDGNIRTEIIAVIQQRRPEPIDGKNMDNGWFWFRGGSTVILDTTEGAQNIRYSIVKNMDSTVRLERQRHTAAGSFLSPLRALYFGKDESEPFAMMHANERRLDNGW